MLKKIWGEIRSNHIAMMAVCCLLPVLFILALQTMGFNSPWLFVAAIVLCVGSHLVMAYFGSKEGGEKSCH